MGDPKLYYDFHINDDLFYDNTTYSLDLYTDRMKELIENHNQENPMFMYLALQVGVKIRNLKVDFKTGGTWFWVGQ